VQGVLIFDWMRERLHRGWDGSARTQPGATFGCFASICFITAILVPFANIGNDQDILPKSEQILSNRCTALIRPVSTYSRKLHKFRNDSVQ